MCGCSFRPKRKEDCFFYEEVQDMSAHIPTCNYHHKLGYCPCEECDKYIKYSDVIKGVREYVNKRNEEDRIQIYIEATKQETTAKLKLKEIGDTGISVAILYDIPIELKPFPMFTKVRIHGKELEFYLGRDNTLIQRDCKPFDFWFGKGD